MEAFGYDEYPVECVPLGDLIPADRKVDLLMIDVEGAELKVMEGIDFDAIRPTYVMIENVSEIGGSEAIRSAMADRGYVLEARIGAADDVFRRQRS
jgi:hypothetical protein